MGREALRETALLFVVAELRGGDGGCGRGQLGVDGGEDLGRGHVSAEGKGEAVAALVELGDFCWS